VQLVGLPAAPDYGACYLTLVAGLLPAIAYVKLIVDTVVLASPVVERVALGYLGLEAVAIAAWAASGGLSICQSLLRVLLGQRVNMLILEKALTLDLAHFEDSEF